MSQLFKEQLGLNFHSPSDHDTQSSSALWQMKLPACTTEQRSWHINAHLRSPLLIVMFLSPWQTFLTLNDTLIKPNKKKMHNYERYRKLMIAAGLRFPCCDSNKVWNITGIKCTSWFAKQLMEQTHLRGWNCSCWCLRTVLAAKSQTIAGAESLKRCETKPFPTSTPWVCQPPKIPQNILGQQSLLCWLTHKGVKKWNRGPEIWISQFLCSLSPLCLLQPERCHSGLSWEEKAWS